MGFSENTKIRNFRKKSCPRIVRNNFKQICKKNERYHKMLENKKNLDLINSEKPVYPRKVHRHLKMNTFLKKDGESIQSRKLRGE